MIVERTSEGKAIAKQKDGFSEGRLKKFENDQLNYALTLLETNSFATVTRITGISKSTLIRERKRREIAKTESD